MDFDVYIIYFLIINLCIFALWLLRTDGTLRKPSLTRAEDFRQKKAAGLC